MLKNSSLLPHLQELRQHIHQHPELGMQENKTRDAIVKFISSYPPDELINPIGETGLALIYNGKKEGPVVLIRAELDALPIQEINDFDYASTVKNVSHKCGHDGHAAILCGLATMLSVERPESGKVVLLFQPAEEDGRGAAAILRDKSFQSIEPDYVFALHNLPGFPLHQIIYRQGSFTTAVKTLVILLHGKTSHAAEPEAGINPALAMAEIFRQTAELDNKDPGRDDFTLITPVYAHLGDRSYGISAGEAEICLTVRSWDNDTLNKLSEILIDIVKRIAESHQLEIELSWTEEFHANQNDKKAVEIIKKATKLNNFALQKKDRPFKFGEDFGLFTEKYPGAMFGVGAGMDMAALHNPDYDFPDEIIPTCVSMFHTIIKEILN